MNITQNQLDRFCTAIRRGVNPTNTRTRTVVIAALKDLGVEVVLTPQERAVTRATELIEECRSPELRAALRLMGRERVSELYEDEALRFLTFFSPDLDFD